MIDSLEREKQNQPVEGAVAKAPRTPSVALVHDYLTQRGGAERVVLALTRAFPGAPLYTSLYEPRGTFPAFADVEVRTLPLHRLRPLRRSHRFAFPLLAPAFSRLEIDADVVVCSSSGWAHAARTRGRKVVYCHAPARWLYQPQRYLGDADVLPRAALALLRRRLERWDRAAARTADRYLANSTAVATSIRDVYGIEAEVLHPPVKVDPGGPTEPVRELEPGYLLCVSRLLPYKNVDAVVDALRTLPGERLAVVGDGPEKPRLRSRAGDNVQLLGSVSDAKLRWLYANAQALVAASYDDFGLTPLEAAAFGRPTAALRFGGFLDTMVAGETGVLFDIARPRAIAAAIRELVERTWDESRIRAHAARFSEEAFVRRIRAIVAEEAAAAIKRPSAALAT